MNRYLSQKFRFFSFACIALLVFVHGYNLKVDYLFPYTMVEEPLTGTAFFEYFFANGFLRFRIPLLFLISGYLFAWQDQSGSYVDRIKKRFKTLWVPYFFWSAFAMLFVFALQQIPATAWIVYEAKVDQFRQNIPYTEIPWYRLLERWFWAPPAYQLWFIFILFVYNAMYPLLRWLVLRIPYIWFPLTAFMWITYFGFIVEGQGLFFFSLGIWMQKRNVNIEQAPTWFSPAMGWALFLGINVVRTFMAFELDTTIYASYMAIHFIYFLSIAIGIVTVWYSLDPVIFWCLRQRWFVWMSAFSFFIYGIHIPLQKFITVWMMHAWVDFTYVRIVVYFSSSLVVLLIALGLGALLRKNVPTFYRVITGGRGI